MRELIPLEPSPGLRPLTASVARLQAMLQEATIYVKSGLLPAVIKTPEQAVLIMVVGRELGIPATYALRNIHVIEGRPTCSAELLMALVHRDYGQGALRVVASDDEHAVVEVKAEGHVARYTWTLADADRAGLRGRANWKQYPRAMLRSRAVSEAARATFPGAIGGLYTAEELGAEVTFAGDEAIDVLPAPPAATQAPTPSPAATASAAGTARGGRAPAAPAGGAAWPTMLESADVAAFYAAAQDQLHLDRAGVKALLGVPESQDTSALNTALTQRKLGGTRQARFAALLDELAVAVDQRQEAPNADAL